MELVLYCVDDELAASGVVGEPLILVADGNGIGENVVDFVVG